MEIMVLNMVIRGEKKGFKIKIIIGRYGVSFFILFLAVLKLFLVCLGLRGHWVVLIPVVTFYYLNIRFRVWSC